MKQENIHKKFGDYYTANENTYIMGIDKRITKNISERFIGKIVLETCTGAGFTTMALAKVASKVISIDLSETNQNQAKENCKIAGCLNKIEFIVGNSLDEKFIHSFKSIDAVFLDPDWAVTGENHVYKFKNSNTKPPADLLLEKVLRITKNIALILPPFINEDELSELSDCEIQKIYLEGEFALLCLYFGNLIKKKGQSKISIA
jgi:tRNA1(Val) A37 N6-methylase TrmN6